MNPQPTGSECIVANIINKNYHGPDKKIVSGTKHFTAGSKVYCILMYGGMGHQRVRVLGRHRISGRMIDVAMATDCIKNFRIQTTYKKRVIDFLNKHPQAAWWDDMIAQFNSMPTKEIPG